MGHGLGHVKYYKLVLGWHVSCPGERRKTTEWITGSLAVAGPGAGIYAPNKQLFLPFCQHLIMDFVLY